MIVFADVLDFASLLFEQYSTRYLEVFVSSRKILSQL